jgi:hypothetical protein
LNAWTNLYETWYAHHGTWVHLNGVLHKPLTSVCVLYSSYRYKATAQLSASLHSVLGNGSVNAFLRQRIQATEELLDASFFYPVSVLSKESVVLSVYSPCRC